MMRLPQHHRITRCRKAGLWRNHPATQQQLTFVFQASPPPPSRRTTQADVLIGLLRARRAAGLTLVILLQHLSWLLE